MPRTSEDVENFLLELDRRFENDHGTYLVSLGEEKPPIAIRVVPPIVAVRVSIGAVPSDHELQLKLFRRLLEYNTTDLMHAAYGIDNGTVVLSSALPLDNLDLNELDATLSDLDLALTRHVPALHELATAKSA
jgi:Tir chaperone protein (CesT) family